MKYAGSELTLFASATNWKRYFASKLKTYVTGRVLDVGCGMGVNAQYLAGPKVSIYTFLEPDPDLLAKVPEHITSPLSYKTERVHGTTKDLIGRQFDTIMYLDVIEHIAESSAELERASTLLAPGGHLLILVPAYNFLFSDFDREIGHFRRYDKKILEKELPPSLEPLFMFYLDSLGLLLSLGNKLVLNQSSPAQAQIAFWDRFVIPASMLTDRLILRSMGRSLVAVLRKPQG